MAIIAHNVLRDPADPRFAFTASFANCRSFLITLGGLVQGSISPNVSVPGMSLFSEKMLCVNPDGSADFELVPGFRPLPGWKISLQYNAQRPYLHATDSRGWLVCQGRCKESFEYAAAPCSGPFICWGCRNT